MNSKAKNTTVGLKELRENMETYIKRVSKGESITVFRRSTPLFRLSPIDSEEAGWETIVDFTKETGRGVPVEQLLASMKKMHGQKSKISQKAQ
ncbi:MAG: type II toxin-antitoxin system prevent-host-death family antitoxin [Patescibacteria group bacterium]